MDNINLSPVSPNSNEEDTGCVSPLRPSIEGGTETQDCDGGPVNTGGLKRKAAESEAVIAKKPRFSLK